MEIRQLRHFLALMETRSYWRAAEMCHLTPQALSKSIRRFEESLGVRLFDRDSRSVNPTLFAERIEAYARNIDAEVRSLRRDLDQMLGTGTNDLAIGVGAAAAMQIAACAVLAVKRWNPKLSVTVVEGTYETLMPQLVNGKIDVFVSIMTRDEVDPLIGHHIVNQETYHLFGRAGHPLAGRKAVTLEELETYPWIMGLDEDRAIEEARESFEAAGLEPPQAQFRTDSVAFAVSLAQASDALFLLPYEMVRRDVEAGLLAVIDVASPPWQRPTAVFFRKNSTRSPDSVRFLDEVRKIVAKGSSATLPTAGCR
ncbi:MAG TPA: LysR family transcriptional regulator [Sphingomonadales bacterium]